MPIDPLATNQVEVVRGPATLRYGSTSIGGVVSATNNRIPEALPCLPGRTVPELRLPVKAPLADAQSASCVTVETRTRRQLGRSRRRRRHSARCRRRQFCRSTPMPMAARPATIDSRLSLSVRPDAAGKRPAAELGAQADGAVGRRLLHLPWRLHWRCDHAERFALSDSRHRRRRSPDPDRRAPDQGHRPRASTGRDAAAIDAVRFWAGATDYKHNEIGLADPADLSSFGVRQTFTNKEQEGRVEVQMTPFNARFAAVTTAFGVQASHQQLTAPSPDDPGSPLNGLWDPNKNTKVAGYVFNEFKFSETHQGADRRPHRACQPQRHDAVVHSGTVRPQRQSRRYRAAGRAQPEFHAEEREHRPDPESAVANWSPASPRNMSSARQSPRNCFRAAGTTPPAPSTSAIPISASRPPRRSRSDCARRPGLSGSKPPPTTPNSTASFTAASPATPARDVACVPADPAAPLELNQAIYSQRDATFRGGEFQSQLDIGPLDGGIWGIENQFDVVRATFDDGSNVPRIPPVRARRRVVLARRQLADADQSAARLRAERYRPDRRDADGGL